MEYHAEKSKAFLVWLEFRSGCSCVAGVLEDEYSGYAIGGLSGGEAKHDFWKVVDALTTLLPKSKPRYVMGVTYAEDLVVCCALGADMFDCVFPTRTAVQYINNEKIILPVLS